MTYPEHDPGLPVVLVDFDGVLAKGTWPSPALGKPDAAAFALCRHYYKLGCQVVVFTARPESHHQRIWRWLRQHGLDQVIYEVTNVKTPACLYVDDRAVRWPL